MVVSIEYAGKGDGFISDDVELCPAVCTEVDVGHQSEVPVPTGGVEAYGV